MFGSPRALLPVIILVSMILASVSANNRLPWSDEGGFASPAFNLAKHGFMGTTVLEPKSTSGNGYPLLRINERSYWVMPGQLVAQAFWYLFVPPTMFLTRLFHILFIPIALLAFYVLLRRITSDNSIALLAAALLGVDFIFYSGAGFARPDMMCMTFGVLGLTAYVVLRQRSLAWAIFVSQLMVAAAMITHPNGVLHFVGVAIIALYYDGTRIFGIRHLALAAAAYVIVFGPWLVYIAQDIPAFRVQLLQNASGNERYAESLNPLRLLWLEIHDRYAVTMGLTSPRLAARLKAVSLLSFAAGVVLVFLRRTWRRVPSLVLLLGVLGGYFVVQCVFNQKLPFYLIHILPFYCAVFACLIVDEFRRNVALRAVIVAWVVVICLAQGALAAGVVSRSYRPNEREMLTFLDTHARAARLIWGSDALIFGMHFDPRLLDDAYLGTRSHKTADVIVVGPLYEIVFDLYRNERPQDWSKIAAQLSRYHLVFENPDYKVYFWPETMEGAGAQTAFRERERQGEISNTRLAQP